MDFLLGLVEAAITVGAIVAVFLIVAALLPLVFSLGTMFDKRTSNE